MADQPFKVAMRPSRFVAVCPKCGEETDIDEWEGGRSDGIWSPLDPEIECAECKAPIDVVPITISPRGKVTPREPSISSQVLLRR